MAALKQAAMANMELNENNSKWSWLTSPFKSWTSFKPEEKVATGTTPVVMQDPQPIAEATAESLTVSQTETVPVESASTLTVGQDVLASLSQPLENESTRKYPDPQAVDQPTVVSIPLPVAVSGQTVEQAQAALQKAAVDNQPADCACCGKQVVLNRHTINFMATEGLRFIVSSWRMAKGSHGAQGIRVNGNPKTPEAILKSRNYSKLQFWGLLEKVNEQKDFWKPTQLGLDFIDGKVALPTTVITYNGDAIGYSGKQVFIHQITRPNSRTED